MPPIKRRQFLQFAGSTLANLGLNQLQIQWYGERYARVLAQDTPRKLALLVGINAYSKGRKWEPLYGAVKDVELQESLLINRFGFNSKNIHILSDQQATREGILEAFEEYLIKQAKPRDVVVFHYSGHGSQVVDPDKDFPDGRNSTLVPIDSSLPFGYPNVGGQVRDIMGHTLFLLMDAIQTENVTFVLDCCHSGGGKRGNLILRSRDGDAELNRQQNPNIKLQVCEAELAYQEKWLSRLGLSPADFVQQRRQGVAKGVVIASAKRDQSAADAPFGDGKFNAGVFTYELTQYLWQQTTNESVNNVMVRVGQYTRTKSPKLQDPEFETKPGSNNAQKEIYFSKHQSPPAEAVITTVKENRIEIHLGGVDPRRLEAFGRGTVLSVVDAEGQEQDLVELESRQGLRGQGKLLQATGHGILKPGALLQERVRGIPSDLILRLGLDSSLGNDIDEARQALQSIRRIEVLALQQQQEVHYILGRVTSEYYQKLQQRRIPDIPDIGSIGLFSAGLELIPGSFGSIRETVTAAVNRLEAKFKSLLAARIVKLVLNADSSRLQLAAAMQIVDGEKESEIIANSFTLRRSGAMASPLSELNQSQAALTSNLQIEVGKQIQVLVKNNEDRDLYVSILLISPDGELDVLFPLNLSALADEALVRAGDTLRVPEVGRERFKLRTKKPLGLAEALIIASANPLRAALKSLQTVAIRGAERRGEPANLQQLRGNSVNLNESPEEVIGSLLNDLDEGTRGSSNLKPVTGTYQVDTTQMAAMSITLEIVEKKDI